MIRPLVASGTVSAAGDNTVLTPTAGSRLVIHYAMYNPLTDNTCFWKFGAGGTPQVRCQVPAESVIARSFSDGFEWRGAVDAPLILNLAVAGSVNYTVYYTERAR